MTDRLDTGMSVTEAIANAARWWGEYRGAVRSDFNRHKDAPKVRASSRRVGGAPALILPGEGGETLPSGILSGKPWDRLTDRERLLITKHWHHHFVRAPEIARAEVEAERIRQTAK